MILSASRLLRGSRFRPHSPVEEARQVIAPAAAPFRVGVAGVLVKYVSYLSLSFSLSAVLPKIAVGVLRVDDDGFVAIRTCSMGFLP